LIVEPNTLREQTTWSPAFSRPMHSSRIAAMPAVPMQPRAFHRAAALHHRHRRFEKRL
jgi:hypothetical protein